MDQPSRTLSLLVDPFPNGFQSPDAVGLSNGSFVGCNELNDVARDLLWQVTYDAHAVLGENALPSLLPPSGAASTCAPAPDDVNVPLKVPGKRKGRTAEQMARSAEQKKLYRKAKLEERQASDCD